MEICKQPKGDGDMQAEREMEICKQHHIEMRHLPAVTDLSVMAVGG